MKTLEQYIFLLFLSAIVLVPLPFASVPVWSMSLFESAIGILLAAWLVLYVMGTASLVSTRTTTLLAVAFLLVVAWALLQTSDLTPASWQHPLWKDVAPPLQAKIVPSISLNPVTGTVFVLKFSSYAAVFWLALQFGRSPTRAKTIIQVLGTASVVYAFYGLIEHFSGTTTILWYKKTSYVNDLTSTFVNKNNYATFAGIGWLCCLSLFYRDYSKWMDGVNLATDRLRNTILFIETKGWKHILFMIILVGALLYSHSRAGFASTVVGIVAFCGALMINTSTDKKLVRKFGLVSFCAALLFFGIGGKVLDERLAGTDLSLEERPQVYALTAVAIGDQPILGSGLGSFEDVFRFYRTPDIGSVYDFAHDSYLEVTLELGIPAAVLVLGSLCIILALCIRGARTRRRDEIYPCLGVGVSMLVGSHSLLDFSIQIPAVAVTFAAVMGVAYAQSWSTQKSNDPAAR